MLGDMNGHTLASPWELVELGPGGSGSGGPAEDPAEAREAELEEAYGRGRADGEQAAHARARREVESALSAARGALQQVRESRDGWGRGLEENLVALATAIARHLVQRELRDEPAAYQALVHEALTTFPPDQAVRVRLHPDDLAVLAALGDGKVPGDEAHGGREARWIADPEVARGGCIVEGPDRIVDGRVDRALERVFRELTHG